MQKNWRQSNWKNRHSIGIRWSQTTFYTVSLSLCSNYILHWKCSYSVSFKSYFWIFAFTSLSLLISFPLPIFTEHLRYTSCSILWENSIKQNRTRIWYHETCNMTSSHIVSKYQKKKFVHQWLEIGRKVEAEYVDLSFRKVMYICGIINIWIPIII